MAFNQKFAPHIATRNGESVETTYFKYRGGHIKSSEKGRGLESYGQDEETVKNKVESREEDGGAVQSQSRTRVWNCIFRIHDLTKRYGTGFGKTQNILTGNGIWLLHGFTKVWSRDAGFFACLSENANQPKGCFVVSAIKANYKLT